jgi:proteasome alpha subunit
MYPPSQAAYDRAITVFSPDGRLFQVEYAREAVRTGSTSIGVVCKDGVVFVANKRIRVEAQKHRHTYSEEIPVEMISKKVGDHIQFYTQYAGVRPYGVSLLIGGADANGLRLFETDPSGALFEYKATAIGAGKKQVEEFFEKEYKDGLSVQDGVRLSLKALRKVVEEKLTANIVDVAIVSKDSKKLRFLSRDEVAAAITEK